ncbi:putative serine/threonine-protein phosphatase C26H8.05c [Tritrichomonas foetus]|uniref:Serine/threonine-protein phosphatase n=1 Tax=Tritrichomonas foetus TaxID=1144522 RepID=A0A1J4L1M9_9EUKA|nr:putative serine/threonine-protein phosphatase C26H8.05c [Tritrichomonas foetus]|eukprot:OHT17322.1 putative serine/threonine-protein phosphatase C26H8.05c [Tritrichomonas foetus]
MGDVNFQQILSDIENNKIIPEDQVTHVLMKLSEVLYNERNVLILQSPIVICGDIHGQFDDLLELFNKSGDKTMQKYLFMGDYVDRGYHGLNTFLYLVCLKLLYPTQYFLLRGNHESRQVSQMYGFYNECLANYGHNGIWTLCNNAFDLLPIAALIDNTVFSVHGGLSPVCPFIDIISTFNREDELPSSGVLCDLCWGDPDCVTKWRISPRGVGFLFGADHVRQFNRLNNIKLITRSHQLANDGFKLYYPQNDDEYSNEKCNYVCEKGNYQPNELTSKRPVDGSLITVWSAPNYQYRSYNKASIMKYNFKGDNTYDIILFDANKVRIVPKDLPLNNSIYFA